MSHDVKNHQNWFSDVNCVRHKAAKKRKQREKPYFGKQGICQSHPVVISKMQFCMVSGM